MNRFSKLTIALSALVMVISCQSDDFSSEVSNVVSDSRIATRSGSGSTFYVGADLSYTNELEDTGVEYTVNGVTTNIFTLFHQYGANMVRLRLWHNPTWTNYSNYADVKKSAKRIKNAGMDILLDFHYSDTWTDPEQNLVPAAWASVVNDTTALADSVCNLLKQVLLRSRMAVFQ